MSARSLNKISTYSMHSSMHLMHYTRRLSIEVHDLLKRAVNSRNSVLFLCTLAFFSSINVFSVIKEECFEWMKASIQFFKRRIDLMTSFA